MHCTMRGPHESPPAPVVERKRAALLAARCGRALAVVRVLITEEFGPHRLPVDCRTRIRAMCGASGFDERALRIVQGEVAGVTPKRIPDLLDEAKALSDRQAGDVDGGVYHIKESVTGNAGKQLSEALALG